MKKRVKKMKKDLSGRENRIKSYGVILGIVTLALQHGIYLLANEAAKLIGNTPFLPKIEAIDGIIPVVTVFIIPYVWAYAFWGMAPMAVSKCDKKHFYDYLMAYFLACMLGALILAFAPTYMDRVAEGLLDDSPGFLNQLRRFWYSLDGGERAYNLFPSFHCINSTVSYLGVMGRKEIPKWFRVYSLITAILIFFSTVFVKQHYVVDVISGIIIALIAYFVCKKFSLGRVIEKCVCGVKSIFIK